LEGAGAFDGVDGEGRLVLDGDGLAVDGEGEDVDGDMLEVGAGAWVEGAGAWSLGADPVAETVGAAGCCRSSCDAQPTRTNPEATTVTNAVTRAREDLLRDAVTP
jgi:hypothetical protein